ncbi:MAG: ATP-binding protein [Bacteroidales bacterium]|jgi:signal transduction histidine kinase|nr:ATP-binding protein [Bacteroidales bacterium]
MKFFEYLTLSSYIALVIVWGGVLIYFLRRSYNLRKDNSQLSILLAILALASFGLLFDSIFFGLWFARNTFNIAKVLNFLSFPHIALIPKLINVISGIVIVVLLIGRWIPLQVKYVDNLNREITRHTKKLIESNLSLRKAKEKAEESNRLKSEFLSNMSHEIRTPMNGIVGFSRMLQKSDVSEKMRKKYIDVIVDSSFKLLSTVDDIMEISRLNTDSFEVLKNNFFVTSLLREIYTEKLKSHKNDNVKFILNELLQDDESVIQSDRIRLKKIVIAVVDNALKFTERGKVVLSAHVKHGNMIIQVRDTGIGISPGLYHTIFEPFSQGKRVNNDIQTGLGLGLCIAKGNAGLIGAKINYKSKKGVWTKFTITLPMKM